MKPAFLITIDTEGDDLWSAPAEITTNNARWVPKFQNLCEEFGLKPTYLTDYEMGLCPVFAPFARQLVVRNAAEVGAHLHPWNTPPIHDITADDQACGPYVTEYPPGLARAKLDVLTRLLEETFETKMVSHRAGRWGFDGPYARALVDQNYLVDCSVTPGVSWKDSLGKPDGAGGPDYSDCPHQPYFVDLSDIRRPGRSPLLELPMTIMSAAPPAVERLRSALPRRAIARRLLNRLVPPLTWLRPDGANRGRMLRVLQRALDERRLYVEFMLHSSELMPGGSRRFPDSSSIEKLYSDMHAVFAAAARCFRAATLGEFARSLASGASPVLGEPVPRSAA